MITRLLPPGVTIVNALNTRRLEFRAQYMLQADFSCIKIPDAVPAPSVILRPSALVCLLRNVTKRGWRFFWGSMVKKITTKNQKLLAKDIVDPALRAFAVTNLEKNPVSGRQEWRINVAAIHRSMGDLAQFDSGKGDEGTLRRLGAHEGKPLPPYQGDVSPR